ncbi:family 16 glycosylhydrolase [Sphingomonas sp.]|uniref:family 16 glycosylhydrolase n=1 Tax=Sphingomonas sp. TaxID=28214 RepID=UPI003BAAC0A4
MASSLRIISKVAATKLALMLTAGWATPVTPHTAESRKNADQAVTAYAAMRNNPMTYRDEPLDMSEWKLAWADEFDYPDAQLDQSWISRQGEFESEWVKGRRWRKNAVVKNGVLELQNHKSASDPHVWSSASIWTKRTFGYGYYEARYKYAGAYGTNNSFWLWPKLKPPPGQKACEIDINEGHYPNVMNTNIHNWTDTWRAPDGREQHLDSQLHHTLQGKRGHSVVLKAPVTTRKIRLRSDNPASIHIEEFRVLAPSARYPAADARHDEAVLNLARMPGARLTTVGTFYQLPSREAFAADGRLETRWVSSKHGPKWLEIEWDEAQIVGAVQIMNGWPAGNGTYRNLMTDYTLEYWDDGKWAELDRFDAATIADHAAEYHTYGFEWSEDYFKWYLDGKLYHTERNDVCFSAMNILLSMAILNQEIAGPVTAKIDGTSMKVDYVRYYRRKSPTGRK